MLTEVLPYLLIIPGVLIGILLGYFLYPLVSPNQAGSQQAVVENLFKRTTLLIDENRVKQRAARQELLHLEDQVTATSQLIRQSQAELSQHQGQLDDLTRDLEEKRFLYREHKAEIDGLQAQLSSHQSRTEALVLAIQKSLEEVEALQTAEQQHIRKRDRLMQTVQNLTNELSLIESTVQSRSLEIQEAEKIRGERDLVLNRLQRERRILETEINRLHQDIDTLDSDLQQLSERQRQLTYSVEQVPADLPTSSRAKLPEDRDTPAPFTPEDEWEFLPNDVALLQGEDDLSAIDGINSFYRDLLHKKGIRTYAQIAYAKPEELWRLLEIPPHFTPDIKTWIQQARALFKQQATTEL